MYKRIKSHPTTLSLYGRRLSKEGKFPKPIQISTVRQGWLEQDINDWIENKYLKAKGQRQNG